MKKRMSWIILCLLLGVGCATLEQLAPIAPSLEFKRFNSARIAPEGIRFEVVMKLVNRMPVTLPLKKMDYQFELNGKNFLTGSFNQFKAFGGFSEQEISLPFILPWKALTTSGLAKNAAAQYHVKFHGQLLLPVELPFAQIPFSMEKDLPVPKLPVISLAGTEGSPFQEKFTVKLKIKNANAFPLAIKTVAAGLKLNQEKYELVNLEEGLTVNAGASQIMALTMTDAVSQGVGMLANVILSRKLDFNVVGQLGFDTPFGEMSLPLELGGNTK